MCHVRGAMRMPVRRKANVAPMELPFGRSREPLPTQHTTRTRTQPTAGMARTTDGPHTQIFHIYHMQDGGRKIYFTDLMFGTESFDN